MGRRLLGSTRLRQHLPLQQPGSAPPPGSPLPHSTNHWPSPLRLPSLTEGLFSAEQRQIVAADERKREFHEEKRSGSEEEEQDGRLASTRLSPLHSG